MSERAYRRFVLPLLAVVASMVTIQLATSYSKSIFYAFGPNGAATLRLGAAAITLNLVLRPWRSWPARPKLGRLLAAGASLSTMILLGHLALAEQHVGAAYSLFILGPLGLSAANSRRARDIIWVLIAALGVWALASAGHRETANLRSILFALGAAAAWAGYIHFGTAATDEFGHAAPALVTALAAIGTLPFGAAHAARILSEPALLPVVLFAGAGSTALTCALEMYAMPRLPSRTFGISMCLDPGWAALVGYLVLGEVLSPIEGVGLGAVVMAAIGSVCTSNSRAGAEGADP